MLSHKGGTAVSFLLLVNFATCCDYSLDKCGAWADGDVKIGVLNSIHSKVETLHAREKPERYNCSEFNIISFVRTLAVIHTIQTINNSGFLPGVRLGYYVCDTCSHASKAIQSAELLLAENGSLSVSCEILRKPNVKAIIGARFSEVSLSLARFLSLYMVPQISTTSSADSLSDKLRYPSFLRTIPGDKYQTKALARLMAYYDWNWVGVIYGDDDYGKSAFHSFLSDAEKAEVCTAFEEELPHYLDDKDLEKKIGNVVDSILSSRANVILLILKEQLVQKLFEEMIKRNISRTWIASDAWSMSRNLAGMDGINKVGDIFGFSFITGQNPGFEEFLERLTLSPGAENYFIKEYNQLGKRSLTEAVDISLTYGEKLAVWSIAHALKSVLECNENVCPGDKDFPPWKLLKELKRVNFSMDNRRFYFSESGNFMNGYDLVNWVRDDSRGKRIAKVVGVFDLEIEDVRIKETITWGNPNNTVPVSKCSKECPPGTAKQLSKTSCCHNCTECLEGTFSNETNLPRCLACPPGQWSLKGWIHCEVKREEYSKWGGPMAIALLTLTGLGVLLLIITLILFVFHWGPVINQAGGSLCFIMMAGLFVSFGSVVLFIGKPNDHICRARQTMYGLGFTLTVSCILVKALRNFLAFFRSESIQDTKKKFYMPFVFVICGTVIQAIICILWLVLDSPRLEVHDSDQEMKIQLVCNEGSGIGFAFMLGYIALLAFISFLLAFRARKVPQRFRDTGYISFSMLIYLFVWVCFIPIYVTKIEERTAVQASAILVSNYGIIFCHFIPKWYMLLCKKKEEITTEAYEERARNHSLSKSSYSRSSMFSRGGSINSRTVPNIMGSQMTVTSKDSGVCSTESYEDVISIIQPDDKVFSSNLRKRHRRRSI
ncbi:G-protein coupled receptor family C group 6 member A-like [Chanos chanos]|uniref:G-protein coupled receptor family C group 6 member A n=1 Tax=Chanos chanos TaxID=29144 RepID=A0A6J2WFW8_CHACN|nr:G-protein coupled receptor family C group 6 member A-like [Chanos chanos]